MQEGSGWCAVLFLLSVKRNIYNKSSVVKYFVPCIRISTFVFPPTHSLYEVYAAGSLEHRVGTVIAINVMQAGANCLRQRKT